MPFFYSNYGIIKTLNNIIYIVYFILIYIIYKII